MNDVTIVKRNGGLNRRNPTEDMVAAIIFQGIAVAGKIALGETKQLFSVNDAITLGLTAAYDTANSTQIFYDINEFFLENPNGELFIMIVDQATIFANMVDPEVNNAKKLLADAEGRVRILGVKFNPAGGYVSVLLTGLDAAVLAAVPKAQLLAEYQDTLNAPLDAVIIDGREFNGTSAAAKDLRTMASDKVSICIHRDHKVLTNTKSSAVGTLVGAISKAKVNENIAWIQKFNVTKTTLGRYLQAGLTNGLAISSFAKSDYDTLDTKGFIFLRSVASVPGLYFNDSHTCTLISSDYAYIEANRTINKIIRGVRAALLPKVSGPLYVDELTGRLSPETAKAFESDAENVIDQMKRDKEISGGSALCDETQNVLVSSEVVVGIDAVPNGTGRKITASIGFKNPFKQ